MTDVWIAYKDGKVLEQVKVPDGVEPRWCCDPRGAAVFRADRAGDLASELFDPDTLSWVPNPEYAAFEIDFNLGPEHKAKAHLQKVMEAKLLQVGIAVEGLLSRESGAIGVPVEELAAKVLEHNSKFEDEEINRREIKKGVST